MAHIETRQIGRGSFLLLAAIDVSGARAADRVKVRNLSAQGMMAEGEAKVSPGTPVKVELRNIGEVEGWVAWSEGNRFGVTFASEIDPALARAPLVVGEGTPRFTRPVLSADDRGPLRTI